MKDSRTSPLYFLDNELRCGIAFLIERVKTDKDDASNELQVQMNVKHKCKQ